MTPPRGGGFGISLAGKATLDPPGLAHPRVGIDTTLAAGERGGGVPGQVYLPAKVVEFKGDP